MIETAILILAGALALDLAFGDPSNRYHPTAWVGTLIAKITVLAKRMRSEKLAGVLITLSAACVVASVLFAYEYAVRQIGGVLSVVMMVAMGSLLLKTTIAIRGLERHGLDVMESLSRNDLEEARSRLAMLVKRNTKNLDKNHITSGVLETTSENIVDGITGPVFYFALFGLPGAFVYRTINTIDSMMGYRNAMFADLGWFGANCDKVLNFLPSRITGYVIVLAAMLLGADWRGSLNTMRRDSKKTQSPNAGYPMAAMAGALGTRFEKVDHYSLGAGTADLGRGHFVAAIRLMRVTCILFCAMVAVPMIAVLSFIGWWIHV